MSLTDRRLSSPGFILLEMLVVITIFSWILIDYSQLLHFRGVQEKGLKQQLEMDRRKQRLLDFLQVNAYLPCPDVDGDGLEDRTVHSGISVCREREGFLPFKTLSVSSGDVWKRRYYYRVHQRSESQRYVNEICQSAAVFARQGNGGLEGAWFCPSSGFLYCDSSAVACREVCFDSDSGRLDCVNNVDLRPVLNAPPYFHLSTPPIGTISAPYGLKVQGDAGNLLESSAVAVILSWGRNGSSVNRNQCRTSLPDRVRENCDGDRDFVQALFGDRPQYLRWIAMDEAKMTLIYAEKLR
ncbi:type II secretion system protein [Thiomicrorhabdus sp.]|uniref:type II secretion system protein n=1 Tax=Thiomicrorhabdus sp. TaxID=2039724 RepID=UPI0029C8ADAF|nr:type II secretion system protein [Thiomicrorhabdus sp.]